ncbi:MAG TPA: hypothetical protein VK392_08860, partial [Thermoanaerobaculia bacterium]|nr:hypothetical protein [Thermoanaerobaculia bacterium]
LPGFDRGEFWRSVFHLAFFLAVFMAIAYSGLSRRQLSRLFVVLGLEAVTIAGYGLFQAVALPNHWPAGVDLLNRFARTPLRAQGIVWRATGPFEEPKWLTIYLLTGIVYLYRCVLASWRSGKAAATIGWFLGIALVDSAVVATASLGGIPAAAVVSGVCLVDFYRRVRARRARWLLATACVLLVLLIALFLQTRSGFARFLGNRIASERGETVHAEYASDYPTGYRYVTNLRYAMSILRESPLVGMGLGEFGSVGRVRGVELGIPSELTRDGPWIGLGGLPAEIGLLGTAALLWLLARALGGRALVRSAESAAGRDDQIAAWLLLLAVLLKEAYSGFYVHFFTWFPLGVAAALVRSNTDVAAAVWSRRGVIE